MLRKLMLTKCVPGVLPASGMATLYLWGEQDDNFV